MGGSGGCLWPVSRSQRQLRSGDNSNLQIALCTGLNPNPLGPHRPLRAQGSRLGCGRAGGGPLSVRPRRPPTLALSPGPRLNLQHPPSTVCTPPRPPPPALPKAKGRGRLFPEPTLPVIGVAVGQLLPECPLRGRPSACQAPCQATLYTHWGRGGGWTRRPATGSLRRVLTLPAHLLPQLGGGCRYSGAPPVQPHTAEHLKLVPPLFFFCPFRAIPAAYGVQSEL